MHTIQPIGYIRSQFENPSDPFEMKKHKSTIVLHAEYEEGLYDIENSPFIDVVFLFHKSKDYKLKINNYFHEEKGVFASRSPKRPNNIGLTTVKLIEKNGCELIVSGLDAIDNTPVLDIKPALSKPVEEDIDQVQIQALKLNPRREIIRMLKTNDLQNLLLNAGQIHGHFCPGLALGVKAATYAMQQMKEISDGMEDLLVITETNSCVSDGVQFVTGCSFGNNALIFKDWGKTAFTLCTRNGKGLRISTQPNSQAYIREENTAFTEQFQKVVIEKNHDPEEKKKLRKAGTEASFNVLEMDFDKIFNVEHVELELPQYAPIHESIICDRCGESTMATRVVEKEGQKQCIACNKKDFFQLDGHGIHHIYF